VHRVHASGGEQRGDGGERRVTVTTPLYGADASLGPNKAGSIVRPAALCAMPKRAHLQRLDHSCAHSARPARRSGAADRCRSDLLPEPDDLRARRTGRALYRHQGNRSFPFGAAVEGPMRDMLLCLLGALRLSLVTLVLCGLAYPLTLTALGQWLLPWQANGSLKTDARGESSVHY
jgi:hypothetical protein